MKLDHTPGPWAVDYDKRRDGADQVLEPTGKTICFMASGLDADTAYANVLLVSKAPELLKVLKEALRVSGCDGDLCGKEWHQDAIRVIHEVEEGA